MKLIKPYTEILTPINGEEFLKIIEQVTRTCKKSEKYIKEGSAIKLVKLLLDDKHEAMIEFADIVVKFVCDRGVSHEIVRHRLASYAQESTRYCNYAANKFEGQITFIEPLWLKDIPELWHEFGDHQMERIDSAARYLEFLSIAEETYTELIQKGWTAEQARSVLPNSLKTEINVKMNLREWRHFFKMRCASAAHPQMRELTIPLLKEFQSKIPIIFDDLIYKDE